MREWVTSNGTQKLLGLQVCLTAILRHVVNNPSPRRPSPSQAGPMGSRSAPACLTRMECPKRPASILPGLESLLRFWGELPKARPEVFVLD